MPTTNRRRTDRSTAGVKSRVPGAASKKSAAARPRVAPAKRKSRKRAANPLRSSLIQLTARRPSRLNKPARRSARLSANGRVLALLWLLPVGIPMMWHPSCTWKRGVKLGITAAAAALVITLLAFPFPTANRNIAGGIQLVAQENEVEIYGPDLPTYIVPGYVDDNAQSIIVPAVENTVHYVYAADGASCYHEYECKFAFASSQRLTVYEAYYLGFKPCPRCNPPKYTGLT